MSQMKAPKGATHKGVNKAGYPMYWLNSKTGAVYTKDDKVITTSARYKGAQGILNLAKAGDCKMVPYTLQLENK